MVQRDGQGPYRLGLALVTLADRVLARLDLQTLARPVLVELMERTGETTTLSLPGEQRGDHGRLGTVAFERRQHGAARAPERRARDRRRQGDAGVRRRAAAA